MCVDANGDVYVPDSEDEEPGMEVVGGGVKVADLGATSVTADVVQMASIGGTTDALAVGADRVLGDGVDVAAEGIPADDVNVAAEERDVDAVKVEADAATSEEMQPEVLAGLKMLLGHIDPTFRDVFISMYKVRSIKIQIYFMHRNRLIFLEKMG